MALGPGFLIMMALLGPSVFFEGFGSHAHFPMDFLIISIAFEASGASEPRDYLVISVMTWCPLAIHSGVTGDLGGWEVRVHRFSQAKRLTSTPQVDEVIPVQNPQTAFSQELRARALGSSSELGG